MGVARASEGEGKNGEGKIFGTLRFYSLLFHTFSLVQLFGSGACRDHRFVSTADTILIANCFTI